MSTINTILIKRRLESSGLNSIPTLSGGELAYSEKNHTLYYGGQFGTLTIAGSGAFVDVLNKQQISGPKTLLGLTTLSAVTFSPNSVIDLGANLITNVLNPVSDQDAATKKYVDDLGSNGGTATANLSAEIYDNFVKLIDNRAVVLNGGLTVSNGLSSNTLYTTGNGQIGGNLRVDGNLEILGATTTIETTTTTTSSFAITNYGTDTALQVTQVDGTNDVAVFNDSTSTALIIKGDGNVGIGTVTPNERLTVFGNISASQNIFAVNGDFTGMLDADGATTLGSTLYVTSAATFASSVSAAGNVDFDSNLNVGGATTLNSTLSTIGASTFMSTITAQSDLSVYGSIYGVLAGTSLVNFLIDGGDF